MNPPCRRSLPNAVISCFSPVLFALATQAHAADAVFTGASVNPTNGPDTNVGLNASKTYDAAINPGGGALTINGVDFTVTDADAVLSGVTTSTGFASGVSGTTGTMLNDFHFGGDPGVITLNNLTAGQTYVLTTYNAQFGNPGGRVATVSSTTSGASIIYDENISPLNLLRYTFTATAASEVVRFQQTVSGDSWHFYGFSDEQVFTNNWSSGNNWTTATWGASGVPNSPGSNATFGSQDAPSTITVDAPQTAGHVQFDGSNSWTVNGSSALTLQADVAGISVLSAKTGTHTISAPLTFASDVMKSGPGTVVLSGDITDAGKNITLGAGTLEIANTSAQMLSGVISGTGAIAKSAAGTLTLNRPETYTGNTVIASGVLKLATRAVVTTSYANAGSYTFTPADNNLLSGRSPTANTNGDAGQEGSGAVSLLTDGAIPAFTKTTTYTIGNNTELTYLLGSSPAGYDVTAVNLFAEWADNGRARIDLTSISYSTIADPATFINIADSDSFAGGGGANVASLTASGGVLAKGVAAIKFTFAGQQNNYVGYRELEVIGTPSGTNILPAATATQIANGATLDLNGLNQTIASLADSGAAGGAVTNSAASTTVTLGLSPAGGSTSFSGTISDSGVANAITLVKSGNGTQILTGTNNYNGVTTVSAGILQFAKPAALYNSTQASWTAANIAAATGATLALNVDSAGTNGFTAAQVDAIKGIGTATTGFTSGSVLGLDTTTATGGTFTYASVIGDTNSTANAIGITKLGVGTLILTGTNTYTGITTISGGTLQVSSNGTTATLGSGNVLDNSVLAFTRANTITVANVISGTGNVSQTGTGTMILTGSNNYSGITTFAAGTVNVTSLADYGANSSLGNRASDSAGGNVGLLFQGGTLQYTGSTAQTTNRSIRVSTTGGAVIDASGSLPEATLSFTATSSPDFYENAGNRNLTLTGSNTGDNTFAMGITQTGGLTSLVKSGSGTWVLTGNSSYGGQTTINSGSLRIRTNTALGAGGFADNPKTTILDGAALEIDGSLSIDEHIHVAGSGIGGGGAIRVLGGATTLTNNIALDDNGTHNVTISVAEGASLTQSSDFYTDTGVVTGLTKTGTGNLLLSGTNTYTGTTTVLGGELGVTGSSIADTNKLVIDGGKIAIAAAADEVVNTLYFGNVGQPAGTYGSTSSGATYQDDSRFSGTGIVTVTTNALYQEWIDGYPSITGNGKLSSADPDGDTFTNLQEYAFGTNPSVSSAAPVTYANGVVTGHGQPTTSITNIANGVDFRAVFGRRKDYVAAGLIYTVQFSADMAAWVNSTATPEVLATDDTIEAVSVPYPLFIPTARGVEKPTFFRVGVSGN